MNPEMFKHRGQQQAAKATAQNKAWFMETKYIDSASGERRSAPRAGRAAPVAAAAGRDRGAEIAAGFAAAARFAAAPAHPTRPRDLRPVEVLPLFPAAPASAAEEHVHVLFDSDPNRGVGPAAAARALVKAEVAEASLGPPVHVCGYLVPAAEGEEGASAAGGGEVSASPVTVGVGGERRRY